MSDTPRTDAAERQSALGQIELIVPANFSRELERENAKLRELVSNCLAKINHTLERGRLRDRLKAI